MIRVFANVLRILIPIVVIVLGSVIAFYLIITRPEPKKTEPEHEATLVEVIEPKLTTEQIIVPAQGTIVPTQSITLQAEVSGKIIEQSNQLIPGGFFNKGDIIAKIDPRDYEYALEQRRAEYERALFELKQEEGRKKVAEREWNLIGEDIQSDLAGRSLALREPQLQFAQANLNAMEKMVEDAKLNLERTVIKAPFNAFVAEESVDIGQYVTPQSVIARLQGTDHFWVDVSIPVNHLKWITFPHDITQKGSSAIVTHEASQVEKEGYVLRLLKHLNPEGRMARVLIQVDDPFDLQSESNSPTIPLLANSFVQVYIEGKAIEGVYKVPWEVLKEGNRLWLMNSQNELEIRNVEIVWERDEQVALIRGEFLNGDKIITSRLPSVIPGMKLRTSSMEDNKLVQTNSQNRKPDDQEPQQENLR